jgi:hypothetical protein
MFILVGIITLLPVSELLNIIKGLIWQDTVLIAGQVKFVGHLAQIVQLAQFSQFARFGQFTAFGCEKIKSVFKLLPNIKKPINIIVNKHDANKNNFDFLYCI